MKNKSSLSTLAALLLFSASGLDAGTVSAQETEKVAGTYTLVSNPPFGDNARGKLILGSDGHYSNNVARATLPKIAAGARGKGTAEENQAIVGGSIFHYGKYLVDQKEHTITFNVETSSYPNWDGTAIKRPFKVSGDLLTYTNTQPSNGGPAQDVVWRRVK